jgi:photosystem II stability/assembly factor-like uncharacterized protein
MERRSIVGVLFVLTLLCALAAATGVARAAGAGPVAIPRGGSETWTVALYANADNDLEYTWPRFTLPALKRIPVSPQLNVVALLDKESKTGSFLYRISGREVTTAKHFTAERDFGDGATFQWFLEQVHQRFPSDHLVVVGWDHGYGWRYFSHDFNSDDKITMPELRAALAGAGVPVDILAFDACNMGDVEVAWDVASVDDPTAVDTPLVDFLVASEETIDQDGYPYDDMFAPLAADPGRSPEQVTDDMLRGWDTYYGSLRCFDWLSLSAVDLAGVRAAGPAMSDLAGRLRAGLAADPAKYGGAVRAAIGSSLSAWDSWQLDLGMFAGRLVDGGRLDDDPGLLAAAAAVRDAVSESMVLGVTSGSYVRWFQGLTVWAGTGGEWTEYRDAYKDESLFGAATAAGGVDWYRLLRDYQKSGQADPAMPEPDWPRATYGLTDVYFADAQHGWATGYDNVKNESVVLRTSNGGRLWQTARPSDGGAYSANALTATPDGRLWVAGSEGWDGALISRSVDQGAAWSYSSVPTLEYLLGIQAVTKRRGYAAGTGGAMLQTGDGGATWKEVATAPKGDLLGLHFASATEGWALANDGVAMSGTVQHTTDGGATWTPQTTVPGALLYGVDSVRQDVWVAGGDPSAGPTLGGERVSGDGVLLHSADGGATWETQWGGGAADLRLSDVDMQGANVGWAVGDGSAAQKALVLHTTDGGDTWVAQDPGDVTFDLAAVHVLDAQTAWVVGDGQAILATTDGGATWTSTRGDVVGPVTHVLPATARRGARASLRYVVVDDWSSRARVTIHVSDGRGHLLKTRPLGWQQTGDGAHAFALRCDLPRGTYLVRAYATDRAGNTQSRMTAGKLRVR